ncbi:MAG: hypothetical protein VW080_12140 [Flavobacteriaceae bacterium]
MKFKIVLYLFLFVSIILFFQLINTNKLLNHQDELIQSQNQLNNELKDSISVLKKINQTNTYFSLVGNRIFNKKPEKDSSIEFVEELNTYLFSINSKGTIKDWLPLENNEETFLIDHVKVINKKWVLIGFRGDLNWGQAVLNYRKISKGNFSFETKAFFTEPL